MQWNTGNICRGLGINLPEQVFNLFIRVALSPTSATQLLTATDRNNHVLLDLGLFGLTG